jgi:hypothetical protein
MRGSPTPQPPIQRRLRGMKSGSRDQGRATAVGSKKRPSPWLAPTGEMRRKQPFNEGEMFVKLSPGLPWRSWRVESAASWSSNLGTRGLTTNRCFNKTALLDNEVMRKFSSLAGKTNTHLPAEYWPAHELCVVVHDVMAQLLVSGQKASVFCKHPANAAMGCSQAAAAGSSRSFQCQGSSSCSRGAG